jgi:hypothetical protein
MPSQRLVAYMARVKSALMALGITSEKKKIKVITRTKLGDTAARLAKIPR